MNNDKIRRKDFRITKIDVAKLAHQSSWTLFLPRPSESHSEYLLICILIPLGSTLERRKALETGKLTTAKGYPKTKKEEREKWNQELNESI